MKINFGSTTAQAFLALIIMALFSSFNNDNEGAKLNSQTFLQYKINGLNNNKNKAYSIDTLLRSDTHFSVSRIDYVNNYGFAVLKPNQSLSENELNTLLSGFNCSVECLSTGIYGDDQIVQPFQCN